MSFPIRKIGMLKMPKIAMLSTNSIMFKKYLFPKGGKTMSFSIRKIGMLEMPKIAMLSTLHTKLFLHTPFNCSSFKFSIVIFIESNTAASVEEEICGVIITRGYSLINCVIV